MTETTDKIIDRDELQASLINQILDDMDIKTMMAILYDNMDESYDKYSVDELIEEVEEYYPHLLEDWSKGGSPKASLWYKKQSTTNKMTDQQMSATIYKQLFTDAEWDAISSAMKDYADYGDEEANIADSIDAKISAIYNLTKWESFSSPLLLSLVLILASNC